MEKTSTTTPTYFASNSRTTNPKALFPETGCLGGERKLIQRHTNFATNDYVLAFNDEAGGWYLRLI